MSGSRVAQTRSIACKVRLLTRELNGFVSEALESFDVTPSQADCLYFLSRGETQPSVIAQQIGLDPSNLSRMIRQFEDRGWIERRVDESNRTRVTLVLTEVGRAVASGIDPHASFVQQTIEKALGADELEGFRAALDRIAGALESTTPTGWAADRVG